MKRSPLKRKPAKRKHRAVRGMCALCGQAQATEVHHRRMRSQGGSDFEDNLLDLCFDCHHHTIHGHPEWAHRHGLILPIWRGYPDPVFGCGFDCKRDHYA